MTLKKQLLYSISSCDHSGPSSRTVGRCLQNQVNTKMKNTRKKIWFLIYVSTVCFAFWTTVKCRRKTPSGRHPTPREQQKTACSDHRIKLRSYLTLHLKTSFEHIHIAGIVQTCEPGTKYFQRGLQSVVSVMQIVSKVYRLVLYAAYYVLLVSPWYTPPGQDPCLSHLRTIVSASGLGLTKFGRSFRLIEGVGTWWGGAARSSEGDGSNRYCCTLLNAGWCKSIGSTLTTTPNP